MFNGSSFSIAISTVKEGIFKVDSIVKELVDAKLDFELVVCHQLLFEQDRAEYISEREALSKKYKSIKIVVDAEKGLSRSRNKALEVSTSDFVFLSDDDNVFLAKGVRETLAYMESNAVDISIGRITTPEGLDFKNYQEKSSLVTSLNSGSVSSLEVCISKKCIRDKMLRFDERFGLGTELPSCEEFIYINDAIKRNAKVSRTRIYVNKHPMESSGKDLTVAKTIVAKGAAFRRVFGFAGVFVIVLFALRKASSFNNLSFILKNSFRGYSVVDISKR
ncbi:glycosyltransferase [Shewanella fidelis]|uniref:glycosyltransferase n=1 Tax=Shewanella fidelis TaxID=173509 RepID=UPI0004918EA7|nr:glycosyltransferase [Shewanella fidelis]